MKPKAVIVITMAICAAFASQASSASTIQQFTALFGPEAAASTPHAVATLPKFDPALGQLVGVMLDINAGLSGGKAFFDNEGAMGGAVTLGYGGTVQVSAMGVSALATMPIQLSDGNVGPDSDGAWDYLGSDAFSFLASPAWNNASTSLDANDDLSAFIGPGSFDAILNSRVKTQLETTGPYGPINVDPGVVEGSITVRYAYVIPEPATFLLLCLGGVILVRRRD